MDSLDNLYEQYYNLMEKNQENTNNGFTTDLLQYGITKDYFEEVLKPLTGKGGITSLAKKLTDCGLNPAKKIDEKYIPDNLEEELAIE